MTTKPPRPRTYPQVPFTSRPRNPLVTAQTLPCLLLALLGIAVIVAIAAGWVTI